MVASAFSDCFFPPSRQGSPVAALDFYAQRLTLSSQMERQHGVCAVRLQLHAELQQVEMWRACTYKRPCTGEGELRYVIGHCKEMKLVFYVSPFWSHGEIQTLVFVSVSPEYT